jgi:3-isopropylmalate/(R)-2-methylmalate dehydratase small subunit
MDKFSPSWCALPLDRSATSTLTRSFLPIGSSVLSALALRLGCSPHGAMIRNFVLNDERSAAQAFLLPAQALAWVRHVSMLCGRFSSTGLTAVIAPSFGDIFRNNCTKNGLAPVILPQAAVEKLWELIEADANTEIVVDMEKLLVEVPSAGFKESFPMDAPTQHRFLNGLDDIGITMTHADEIDSFEKTRPSWLKR